MPERKTKVRTYRVDYICNHCGEGLMEFTDFALLSNPPKYEHQCNVCKSKRHFSGVKYPHFTHEADDA